MESANDQSPSESAEQRWAEKAPLTVAALGPLGERGPRPIEREWWTLLDDDQDLVFCWAGGVNRRGTQLGWSMFLVNVGGERDDHGYKGGHPNPVLSPPAAKVERLLAPLAHESRVRIMQAMYDGPKSSGELSQATGLTGGNLYYHLKELMHAAYVKDTGGAYDLTELGYQLLITVTAIAQAKVTDRGEEGLLINPR